MLYRVKLTWPQIEEASSDLARQIRSHCGDELENHLIIAVARGGLIPATMLSYELKIPISCVVYPNKESGLYRFGVDRSKKYEDKKYKALVVDDIADTGRTLKGIQGYLRARTVVSLVAKPLGAPFCTCVWMKCAQNIWVDFPWAPDDYKPDEHVPG